MIIDVRGVEVISARGAGGGALCGLLCHGPPTIERPLCCISAPKFQEEATKDVL